MTKLSSAVTVRRVRVRGGNFKFRALRLDHGNFSWPSEAVTRKVRVLDVAYNASNNELVRTQTLVKGAIVQVDAAPFKQWYAARYGADVGLKKQGAAAAAAPAAAEEKKSAHAARKLKTRAAGRRALCTTTSMLRLPQTTTLLMSSRAAAAASSRGGIPD